MISVAAKSLSSAQLYRLLAGLVVPRPIAFISTLSTTGVRNLAPFSFFTVLNAAPPILGVSIDRRYGTEPKDTLVNIEATGEFVINIVSEGLAEAMNLASLDWRPQVDEFVEAGLDARADNLFVQSPRVAASPGQFECRLVRSISFGSYTLVAGEVVAFHYAERLFDDKLRIDYDELRAVGRLTGSMYCRTHDRFSIERTADSPDKKLGDNTC